jgi:hypothetical protein
MGRRFRRLASLLTVALMVGAVVAPSVASAGHHDTDFEKVTQLHRAHRYTVGHGDCSWHFVHTKAPKGSEPISLLLKIKTKVDGKWVVSHVPVGASKKIQAHGKNQHWTVETSGKVKLKTAWTNQTGKLVLSDLTCKPMKPSGPGEPDPS